MCKLSSPHVFTFHNLSRKWMAREERNNDNWIGDIFTIFYSSNWIFVFLLVISCGHFLFCLRVTLWRRFCMTTWICMWKRKEGKKKGKWRVTHIHFEKKHKNELKMQEINWCTCIMCDAKQKNRVIAPKMGSSELFKFIYRNISSFGIPF